MTDSPTRTIRFRFQGKKGLAELLEGGGLRTLEGPEVQELDQVDLLPPARPTKLIGIGRNYKTHAEELKNPLPEEPLMFMMPSTAVIASGQPIIRPRGYEQVHYEGELAMIFGKRARHVPAGEAMSVIAGLSCLNDVSVRDLQKKDGQFTRAKGFDTFAPLGPCMASGLDWSDLRIITRVDGEVRQDATTAEMIFGVPQLVEAVTRVMTMLPGDVIATGTPAGVGQIQPGSVIEVEIEGIGTLSNPVVLEQERP